MFQIYRVRRGFLSIGSFYFQPRIEKLYLKKKFDKHENLDHHPQIVNDNTKHGTYAIFLSDSVRNGENHQFLS